MDEELIRNPGNRAVTLEFVVIHDDGSTLTIPMTFEPGQAWSITVFKKVGADLARARGNRAG